MHDLLDTYHQDVVDAFNSEIVSSHRRRIRVIVKDQAGALKEEITEVLGGGVQVDRQARPHRQLSLEIHRPKTRLAPGDLWLTDTWQVLYEVYVATADTATYDYEGWVSVPIFAGMIRPGGLRPTQLYGSVVQVSAVGYDGRYNTPLGSANMLAKGMRNSTAVAAVLDYHDDRCGHDHLSRRFEQSTARLAENWLYGTSALGGNRPITTLAAAKLLGAGCGGWAFYIDANFIGVLRPISTNPVLTFSEDNANILSPPNPEIKLDDFCNVLVVHGAKALGKPQVRGRAVAATPYSPTDLKEWWCMELDASSAGTDQAANELAEMRLAERLRVETTISVDTLIDPRLEEYDYIQVDYDDIAFVVPALSFNIPLTEGSQTISSARSTPPERALAARRRRLRAR